MKLSLTSKSIFTLYIIKNIIVSAYILSDIYKCDNMSCPPYGTSDDCYCQKGHFTRFTRSNVLIFEIGKV